MKLSRQNRVRILRIAAAARPATRFLLLAVSCLLGMAFLWAISLAIAVSTGGKH